MTFLEKLKVEYPEDVKAPINFNWLDCPSMYGYEPDGRCPPNINKNCEKCWNREIPEPEAEKTSFKKKCEELYTWCENSKCEECPLNDLIDYGEVCEFEKKHEERLDKFLEAIHAAEKKTEPEAPAIKDSGNRREFETGAVRDMQEGKGRMDLLPWAAIIEVSKHCENGAKKYGEHNVDKGIPLHSLCDSAARHLAKFMDGQIDEPHLLAAAWNLLWAVQMRLKKPEMCDVPWEEAEK